ncbi:MAG: hypothetical protein MUC41_10425 [Syntrophobacteraceae bacterium]|jgi:hypothetical protein|nr:hypothetical protein [Syntrophobacteraceae bacterium]
MDPKETPREQGSPPRRNGFDYAEDGVDVTLIRWMLSLTPTERPQVLQQNIQSLRRLIDEIEFI